MPDPSLQSFSVLQERFAAIRADQDALATDVTSLLAWGQHLTGMLVTLLRHLREEEALHSRLPQGVSTDALAPLVARQHQHRHHRRQMLALLEQWLAEDPGPA